MDIDEDDVVASFSVFFSPTLAHQTHIFQYPLRCKRRPYEFAEASLYCTDGVDERPGRNVASYPNERTVINPSSRLTMKYSLDTFGSSSFKNESEGKNSGADAISQMELQKQNTYSYTLQSVPFHARSKYMLGYITENGIHLTPVSTIQQFTPVLGVIDSSQGAVRIGDQFCSHQCSPIVPGFAGSDRIQKELLRQRSATLNADASTGKEIQFFPSNSIESSAMRSRLRSTTTESLPKAPGADAEVASLAENSLFPPEILRSGGITGGEDAHNALIIHRFANRSHVGDQVTQLLQRCHILPLSVLQTMIVPNTANEVVRNSGVVPVALLMEALKECAVCMHGVWVSRNCDRFVGVVAALREVILIYFYQSTDGSVARGDLNKLVNSSSLRRSVKEILETIAVLNMEEKDPQRRRWRLKYVSSDHSAREEAVQNFRTSFPSEVMSQTEAWRRRCAQVGSHFPYLSAGRPPPQLLFAQRSIGSSSQLPHSSQQVPLPVSNITGMMSTAPAVNISPSGSGDASLRDAELAPIRMYIRQLFAEYGVINKQRAKEKVLKMREEKYPHATNAMLSSSLQSSVRQFTAATWVLQSLGEPLVDQYRPIILDVVLDLKMFEMRSLQSRLDEVMRERGLAQGSAANPGEKATTVDSPKKDDSLQHLIPDSVVQRVVSEVAEYKVGERLWHLKGGNVMNF